MRSLAAGVAHLRAAEELLPALPDELLRSDLRAIIRGQHGVMLMRVRRIDEAIEFVSEAIAIGEQAIGQGRRSHLALATDLGNLGIAHGLAGLAGPARNDYRRSAEVAEQALRDGSPDDVRAAMMIAAKAQYNLGELEARVGDIPTALRHYEESSRRFREIDPSLLANLRSHQAEALLAAGLAEEAARQLDEAIPELRRHGDHNDLGEAQMFRAAAAVLEGDPQAARKLANAAQRQFLRRGSEVWATIAALTGLRAEVSAALNRGRVPAKLPGRALTLADELTRLRLVDEATVARLLAVRLHLRRGAVDAAAALLDQVRKLRLAAPIDHRMLLRLCRAELAVARGEHRRAFRQADVGLVELGRVRDRMGGLELVCGTAVHGRELGELAVRLVLDRRQPARRLFVWSERTRAQVYRYEPLPPIDNPVLAQRLEEYRHLSRMAQGAALTGEPRRELLTRHAALQREVMRLGWRDSPWGRPRPIAELADVATRLGDRVLVSYVASGGELVAVVVADGRARMVRLGSGAPAAAAARELHADLDALSPDRLPAPLVEAVSRSARTRAARLDEQLLRPLDRIIGDREVVVVPTGALYAVAWGVLPSLRGRPVVVAPSATAWFGAAGQDSRPGHTVLVGGPGLSATVGEVGRLREHHPGARLIDAERATVSAVRDALDGATLAHLAAHGAHEPENALFSHLELVDGALYAHETARLRRPPEHVVLAACELALSRIRSGDEALGFAGALLAAGGRTVTAAVSRVGDEAAAAAMADYHQRLALGAPPATALAEATATEPLRRPFVCLGASRD
ncbi:MAG TPA: CHAT domain-containing protein [Pseudonocardiaceae bacterium]|nr:CHAT domain-containing protein [Pseudonocardiaceae bacterium]